MLVSANDELGFRAQNPPSLDFKARILTPLLLLILVVLLVVVVPVRRHLLLLLGRLVEAVRREVQRHVGVLDRDALAALRVVRVELRAVAADAVRHVEVVLLALVEEEIVLPRVADE